MQFPKYVKIKVLGSEENRDIFLNNNDDIVVEEKLDGANTRIYITDGKIIFGSRNVQLTSDDGMIDNVPRNFKRSNDFIKNKLNNVDLHKYNGLILFGETMVRHTLDYDWLHIPPMLMFDVFDTETGIYLDYEHKTQIFKDLDLPVVPLIARKKAKEIREMKIDDEFVPKSAWRNGKAEGVVFKNYDRQIFAKYVRSEFKEENRQAFGSSKKYAKDDSEKVVYAYCTNPRIEKAIMKLIDEKDIPLDMKMMQYLPKMVWGDIVEEEGANLLHSNYVLDMKRIRKSIAKRCLAVLRQMIVNNIITKGGKDEY